MEIPDSLLNLTALTLDSLAETLSRDGMARKIVSRIGRASFPHNLISDILMTEFDAAGTNRSLSFIGKYANKRFMICDYLYRGTADQVVPKSPESKVD